MVRFLQTKKSQTNNKAMSSSLEQNMQEVKRLFSNEINNDFAVRPLSIHFNNKQGCLFYLNSIVDIDMINNHIIQPLLFEKGNSVEDTISMDGIEKLSSFPSIAQNISNGQVVFFMDGDNQAYAINVAKFQHRAIANSENETTIKGPNEAFTESANANISLIRKQVRNHMLINEGIQVGERSPSEINVLYIKDLVNNDILENVKERLNNIKTDSVRNIEVLEQYIEERPYSLLPTILYTEKPDKASSYLEEGYVVLLLGNSSACLIMPVTFWSFFHTGEDRYLRFWYGNFTRTLRLFCFFLTLLFSASYVAISNFHSEMIPPDLLLAITASRERVPFPLIMEIIIMEMAFELIREAGLRIPTPLGPTIGIVGALILGQAAVEANIISPIIIIVVAISGLSSFAIANTDMNYTVRLMRFPLIIAAGLYGMLSLIGVFLIIFMYTASIKSCGIPYFSPMTPYSRSSGDKIYRKVARKEYFRPGFLKLKDIQKKSKQHL